MRPILALITLALLAFAAPSFAQTRATPAAPPPASNLIDLNNASGEVRADAIIRARPFKAKTELVERRLIPESLYEKIADKVMARPPPAAPAPARPAPQKRT